VSDPNRPGATPPGAESDATTIRSTEDFSGDNGGAHNSGDRMREWVRRSRGDGAEHGPPPGSESGGAPAQPVLPRSANLDAGSVVTPAHPPAASAGSETARPGSQQYRAGDTASESAATGSGASAEVDADGEVTAESGDDHRTGGSRVQGAFAGAGSIASRLKERAKTVSAGMAGAAAGAAGTSDRDVEATGQAASAVPSPNEETMAVRRSGVPRRTRKARLRLSQVDPWSVMKTAFLFSVAAGIVLWVATGTVWAVISSSGMFEEINRMVGDIIQTPGDDTPFRIQDYISTNKVMGTAALIAVIDVVIFTALATLGAFLYNLASAMIGGLEVTLAED
jgi:hypothetical protein